MRHWISLLLIGVALLSTPSHAQRIVDADQIRKPNRAGTLTVPSVSGVISCVSCTESLSNKTLISPTLSGTMSGGTVSGTTVTVNDDVLTIQDNAAPTKKLQFQVSGVSANTTRTLTVPDISSTIAVLGLAQTFTALQNFSGIGLAVTTRTSGYTLTSTDDIIFCNAAGGAFTITFPAAASNANKTYILKKTDSSFNAVTLSGTGMTTNFLMTVGEEVMFVSNGSTWEQVFRTTDTPWISYSLTVGAVTTPPTKASSPQIDEARWRRVGDSIEVTYSYQQTANTGAAAGSGIYLFPIPNSAAWTIDTAKQAVNTNNNRIVGHGFGSSTTSNDQWIQVAAYNTTNVSLRGLNETSRIIVASGAANMDFTNTAMNVSFRYTVPITNFSQ